MNRAAEDRSVKQGTGRHITLSHGHDPAAMEAAGVAAKIRLGRQARPPTDEEMTVIRLALAELLAPPVRRGEGDAERWRFSGRWWHAYRP